MYSQYTPPAGIGRVRVRPGVRECLVCEHLACAPILANTWVVWNRETLIVEALFYGEPNTHGWSPPEAHASSYLNRASPVNPFDLDSIP